MRKWEYQEYSEDGPEIVRITEEEIIRDYWPYWRDKIYSIDNINTLATRKLSEEAQKEKCIEDFVVVNWCIGVYDE